MDSGMRRLAVIPARGGSKRLPRKNIVDFEGRPILAYTVRAALESGVFARVLCSTDDPEIADIAARAGAVVVMRPDSLATDTAQVWQVCKYVLEAEAEEGRDYDLLCCLYPTAPLRNAEDIRAVTGLIVPGHCDFALAVTTFDYPPHQALRVGGDGVLSPMWPDMVNLRSQEVGELLVDNGSTYAVSVAAFLSSHSFYGPGLRGYRMPRERSVDIDDAGQLELARFYARRLAGEGSL
jgi:pseudaminic acid cytidylyltransferase